MRISIRQLCVAAVALNAVAATALCIAWTMYLKQTEKVVAAQENRYYSYLLADELRQSSDDLTRLARTYVVTGEDAYERQYLDVVAIRGGEKPRPTEYHRIYWDFIAAGLPAPRPTGRQIALLDLMREAGFSAGELGKLDEAKSRSDGLIQMEVKAMNAVKGLFADANGGYTVRGAPDFALARELLHSPQYHKFKAEIMQPIDDFFVLLDERTSGTIAAEMSTAKTYSAVVIGALALLAGTVLSTAFIIFNRVLRPLDRQRRVMVALSREDTSVGRIR